MTEPKKPWFKQPSLREAIGQPARVKPEKFSGIRLEGETITYEKDTQPLAGVTASVESVGAIRQRATLTRTLGTGGLGLFLFKKKVDDRDLFLTIEGPAFQWLIDVDPKKQKDAREFAAKVNTAAKRA